MGRAKLPLRLINGEKSRKSTFLKRLKGLKKKTSELSTLCAVDACLIYSGPDGGTPESWPENPLPIIQRHMSLSQEQRKKRQLDLCLFLEQTVVKKRQELEQKQRENARVLDQNLSKDLSMEELRGFMGLLDWKLEMVNHRVQILNTPVLPMSHEKAMISDMGFYGGLPEINGSISDAGMGLGFSDLQAKVFMNHVESKKGAFPSCLPFSDMGFQGGLVTQGGIDNGKSYYHDSMYNMGSSGMVALQDLVFKDEKEIKPKNKMVVSGLNVWSNGYKCSSSSSSCVGFDDLETQWPLFQPYADHEGLGWNGNFDFLDF